MDSTAPALAQSKAEAEQHPWHYKRRPGFEDDVQIFETGVMASGGTSALTPPFAQFASFQLHKYATRHKGSWHLVLS